MLDILLRFFGLKTVFAELLHAKPCRIIKKVYQQASFGCPCFFCVTHVSHKSSFFTSRHFFLMGKPCSGVLQVSGRNMLENAYKVTSTSKFSTHFVQIPYHLHPALSYSLCFLNFAAQSICKICGLRICCIS